VLPPVLRRASAVAAGRAGLVPFLALARAARQPLAVALPLSTLLLGLGFAVFASGVTATVDEGQERAAWREVGADYLLQAEYFEDQDLATLADLPGVDQVVPALRRERATFFDPAGRATDGNVLVVDAAGYADLLARDPGSGADPDAVRRLAEPVGPEAPLSALATAPARAALAADEGPIDPTASLGRTEVAVTATPATFPLDGGLGLVVLDLPSVQERESFPIRPNTLLVRGSPEAAPELEAAVANLEQRVVLTDRRAELEDLADSPFVGSTQGLFAAGAAAAAAYCLLALTLTLVLAARSRARLASTLRMLGAGPRGLSRLAVLEVAPLIGVMLVAGAAAGLLLVALLLPALDLQPLTGGAAAPETRLGLLRAAGLVAGLTALVVATVAGVSAVERRRGLGETLREGDEP
jgi:putative ABC transport system permease protein